MSNDKKTRPPRWMQTLLTRFADEATLEEVEGDLLELYPGWVRTTGTVRANWKYLFTVVTLRRPLKKRKKELSNTTVMIMIKSYFVMSWRTILKNKVSSLINLSGLTLGLSTSLLILLIVLKEFEYDQHHEKKDSIFLMMKNQKTNDGIWTGRSTPGPLAETLKSDYSEVVHAARVASFNDKPVFVDDHKSIESGVYADPDIFRMMTFKAVKGDPATALEANSIVLSTTAATKLFGQYDPIGRTIIVGTGTFSVGAVIEDIPGSSTLKFQIAVPFEAFEKINDWLVKWDDNRIQTWVELRTANDLTPFNKTVSSLIQQKTNDPNETVFAYPLSQLHLYGDFSNGQPSGGLINMVWVLIGFGIFMLLIACVNFMNIATAQSVHRSREVGVRKVLGATRRWIIIQFLNESFVFTFLSLVAAITLCILVIPSFNSIMQTSITFEFNKAILWILCLLLTVLTTLVAGGYPAFVLSGFSPVRVLKGVIDRQGGLILRRILVTFQFVISIFVLVGTIVLYAQFNYVRNRPMGYQQENLINLSLDSLASAKFNVIRDEVSKISGVASITGTEGNILDANGSLTGMDWPGKKPGEDLSVVISNVEYDWTKTMGIEMKIGRDFSSQYKSDEGACLLNESAVDKMGLTNPIGSVVGGRPVIGVFKNYVYNNPSGVIAPMAVYFAPDRVHHLYVRIDNNESWRKTIDAIGNAVKKVSPEMTLDFRFTSDEYQAHFEEIMNLGTMVSVFIGMTIFISCLGLFGLSGFIAQRRSKEMSIRKVFGADKMKVLLSLSTDVLKPVIIALLIVIPLSVWTGQMLLNQFVYRVSLTWWMFAKATILVLAIAFLIILYHARRTARENPSSRLRSE